MDGGLKLTLTLEIDENHSGFAELDLTDEDMSDDKKLQEYLEITWKAVRNHYRQLKRVDRQIQ